MTAIVDNRIDRLEERVDRLEATIASDIRHIRERLEALTLTSSKQACPSPGACVTLGDQLKHVIESHNATMLRVERLELKILDMDRAVITQFNKIEVQKAWVLGAWSVVAFLSAIVGAAVPLVFNLFVK